MRRRAATAALVALAAAAPAAAHVIPQPAYLTPGEQTTISFVAPNERLPHVLTGLTVTVPAGLELAAAPAPPGWSLSITGQKATWNRTAGRPSTQESFRIVASTSLPPGAVTLNAAQRYDDGGIVRWPIRFTILPGATPTPRQHLLPAIVTAILGLVVIGLLLYRMRDRHHPDLRED